MDDPSSIVHLADIIDATEFIRSELDGVPLNVFERDRRKRWLVERGIEIISEASRRLDLDLKVRHPEIAWPKIAAIGNVLRHEYRRIAYDVLWIVARDELPRLERICRDELARLSARDQGSPASNGVSDPFEA